MLDPLLFDQCELFIHTQHSAYEHLYIFLKIAEAIWSSCFLMASSLSSTSSEIKTCCYIFRLRVNLWISWIWRTLWLNRVNHGTASTFLLLRPGANGMQSMRNRPKYIPSAKSKKIPSSISELCQVALTTLIIRNVKTPSKCQWAKPTAIGRFL